MATIFWDQSKLYQLVYYYERYEFIIVYIS